MELLLTILSGLALWALLGVLVWALGRVQAALEGINRSLAKIAMGVRAIESETAILKATLPPTATTLADIAAGAEAIGASLIAANQRLST